MLIVTETSYYGWSEPLSWAALAIIALGSLLAVAPSNLMLNMFSAISVTL